MAFLIPSQATDTATPLELADLPGFDQSAGRRRSPAIRALQRMGKAVRSNRKATWGAGLLIFFCLLSAFPGLIA